MPRKRARIDAEQVEAYLLRCKQNGTAPRVSELAHELGVSRVTLNKRFQENTGRPLSDYFFERRDQSAMELLRASTMAAHLVATMSGFGTPRNFHRVFARRFGTTPGVYRRQNQDSLVA